MPRYDNRYGQLDDLPVTDGDSFFVGFRSRLNPTSLQPGQLWYSGNMRLNRGTAKVRNGIKMLSLDIDVDNVALLVGTATLANDLAVSSLTRSSGTVTVTTSASHGYTTGQKINIRGATPTNYNGDWTITVTDSTHFTFGITGSPTTPATGTILANGGPVVFNTYTDQVMGSGLYADTTTNTEGIIIAANQNAYLYRYGETTLSIAYPSNETCDPGDPCWVIQFESHVFIFRGFNKTQLTWNLDLGNLNFTVVPQSPLTSPLIPMPHSPWGIFFNSRFIMPYQSLLQLIFSNVSDTGTYDPTVNQFQMLPGAADYIVAAIPYQQLNLLVLYRKSILSLTLDASSLTVANAYEITRSIGCVCQKSVANCGDVIVWLSDIGVFQMAIQNDLSLVPSQLPLSDRIDDIIQSINWTYSTNAVAAYWNNRYYLAVPIGSATRNTTLLVYNFLNQEWESVDTFPMGFDIQNLIIMSYNGRERLHAVSSQAFVCVLEEGNQDQFGVPPNYSFFPIQGSLKTRNYLANTFDMKRFRRFQLQSNLSSGDSFTGNYVLDNPTYTVPALSFTASSDGDIALRANVGRRGISGRLELASSAGQPEFTTMTLEGTVDGRMTLNYK